MTDIGKMCDECILLFDYRLSYVTGRMKQELYYFITYYLVQRMDTCINQHMVTGKPLNHAQLQNDLGYT